MAAVVHPNLALIYGAESWIGLSPCSCSSISVAAPWPPARPTWRPSTVGGSGLRSGSRQGRTAHPFGRNPPSRHQTGEHSLRRGWHTQTPRLWPCADRKNRRLRPCDDSDRHLNRDPSIADETEIIGFSHECHAWRWLGTLAYLSRGGASGGTYRTPPSTCGRWRWSSMRAITNVNPVRRDSKDETIDAILIADVKDPRDSRWSVPNPSRSS